MDINKILKSDYLDILYQDRNKSYGSYDLRRKYADRMKKSGITILAFGLISIAYNVFANRIKLVKNTPPPPPIEVKLLEPPPIDDKQPPPPPPPSEPPPPVKPTVAFTPPEIKKDEEIKEDKQMVEQDKLKDAAAGLKTEEGNVDGIDPGIVDKPGTGTVVEAAPAAPEIFKVVEQMPEFPGGEGALYKWLADNVEYPAKATQASVQGTVRVKFVVNEDGSISNVAVGGKEIGYDLEKEAVRVVSKMPRWKPGKNNGKAVKVYYQVPIRFVLQ